VPILDPPAEARERLPQLQKALGPISNSLLTPALVIDLAAVEHNIGAFIAHIGGAKRWRPHIKTVKQSRIVRMLMKRGVWSFKCSTLDELALVLDVAERVHPEGHVDVLLAYPVTRTAAHGVAGMMRDYEGGHIRLLADSPEHFHAVAGWLAEAEAPGKAGVLLDVDTGMHRTGTDASTWRAALPDLLAVHQVQVLGLHGYEGHLEWTDRQLAHDGYDRLVELARELPKPKRRGDVLHVVTSGTHTFEHALQHKGLDDGAWRHQVSPGTLVLSDLRTAVPAAELGLRQAVFVASRVISRPGADRVTLDAGNKAMCPDRPTPACAILGWPNLEALEPSEEHRPAVARSGERPALGDLLFLVPEHACTTVNLHRYVQYVEGGAHVGRGPIEAMSRTSRLDDRRP
jgi:D-serine deaminase-like pyridoxal phosphate-dependent protein